MQRANRSYPAQSDYPDWHYQPIRLLKREMENPLEVINVFFSGCTLPQARRHFKEMLEDAMCAVEVYSVNYLTLYDSIEKLIEAAWLIRQRETTNDIVTSLLPADSGLDALIQLLATTIRPERIFLLSEESTAIDYCSRHIRQALLSLKHTHRSFLLWFEPFLFSPHSICFYTV